MGSALLDKAAALSTPDEAVAELWGNTPQATRVEEAAGALRQEAAARLAAHRSRRAGRDAAAPLTLSATPRNARSAKIAAAVAERYAQTPTYKDFLAAEAERTVQEARAAAEIAALNARAVAAAQQSLLKALEAEDEAVGRTEVLREEMLASTLADRPAPQNEQGPSVAAMLWPDLAAERNCAPRPFQPPVSRPKQARRRRASQSGDAEDSRETAAAAAAVHPSTSIATLADGITIRLYQDESGATRVALDPPTASPLASAEPAAARYASYGRLSDEEARLLDEEIAFRQEPVFEEPCGPPMPLPANLIAFPRQLVASRKARPRLAEGPLREEAYDAAGIGQLRIFEVEPEQIGTAPESDADEAAASCAQWTTIWLDSQPDGALPRMNTGEESASAPATAPAGVRAARSMPEVASVGRRAQAAAINAAVLFAMFAAFVAVFLWTAAHIPVGGAAAHLSMLAEAHTFLNLAVLQAALPFAVCIFALLATIYQALFFALSTATPGMRAARIALCTFRGENPSRAAVRRRLLALLVSTLPMGFGFIWAALDEERLSWHDRLCGIYQRSY